MVDGTIYCDSKNGKRNIVRISKEQADRDIDCKWAYRKEMQNVRNSV
ncbi:MAG: hypothetical protein J5819_00125 [Eubacterium sp.]|nr:hypothetical protein [Eubacterium sp.]